MKLTADSAKAIAILAGLAVAAVVAWKLYQGAGKVASLVDDAVTKDLNPFSTENSVYRQFDTRDAQGNVTGSLGTDVYDAFHHSDGSFKWPWEENKGF